MKDYQYLLFDLDGTLIASADGILKGLRYALKAIGETVPDDTVLMRFIGPSLYYSLCNVLGFPPEKAMRAAESYWEYYRETGIFECHVFDGMEDALQTFLAAGKTLLVATAKPELFTMRILEHFGLTKYFSFVAGATIDDTRAEKDDIIRCAACSVGITDISDAVMIGDKKYDVIGAKENGMDCIGVLFGYGSAKELEDAGAVALAETPADLVSLLLGK